MSSAPPSSPPSLGQGQTVIRRQSRLFAALTYAGIGMFLLGTIGRAYVPIFVALAGFPLIIIGGVGLFALARRERLRPTGPGLSPQLPTYFAPLELRTPSPAGALPGADLSLPVTFDLRTEYQAYKRGLRSSVYLRVGMYLFFLAVASWALVEGILRKDPTLIGVGVAFIALPSFGFTVLRSVYQGVTSLTIGPAGVEFALDTSEKVLLHWEDPRFGIRIIEKPAEVNRLADPPRATASYRLFTGPGSGVGRPPRILTEVPAECVNIVMAYASARQLQILPGVQGVPGTMSARRTLTVVSTTARA